MDPVMDQQVWNIFEMPPEDIATVYKQDIEIKTEPSVLSAGNVQTVPGTIRLLTRDLDAWLLPSEARLRVRFRVQTAAGLGANVPITLINGGYNLFDNLEIKLNGKTVDRVDKPGKVQLMYGYAAYSAEYVKQCQELEWFYPESTTHSNGPITGLWGQTGGGRQLTGFANAVDNETQFGDLDRTNANSILATSAIIAATRAKRNDSFARRFKRTRGGRQVELWLPLSAVSGFCKDNTKVIRGMTMEVSLNRDQEWARILHSQLNTLGTSLVEGAAVGAISPYAIVDEVSLFIPQLKPSLAMASHIEQQLANDAVTKWVFSEYTTFQSDFYPINTPQVRWLITSTAHRPTLAIVGFQAQRQYNQFNDETALFRAGIAAGDNLLQGAVFPIETTPRSTTRQQHSCANGGLFSSLGDITSVEFRINGLIVPNESYQISFRDETYKRAYYDFRKAFHKDDPMEQGIYDEFTYKDSPLFLFDLRAIGMESIYQNIKTNNIEFRANVVNPDDDAAAADNGLWGPKSYQIFCMLVTEKEASVEAKGGRLSIMP